MKNLGNLVNKKILLVDDEPKILIMVSEMLTEYGFSNLITANTYKSALSLAFDESPDLAILDVMLPDGNGFDLMDEMKSIFPDKDLPILFLTAKDTDEDIIHGLGLGADDYIVKPFNSRELLFRIINILKRTYRSEMKLVKLKDSIVDLENASVNINGETIALTATELKIFKYLYENSGRIVTSDQIIENVWEGNSWGYENSLMAHISRLRQKIELDSSNPKSLITIKGLGYRLNAEEG